MSNGESEVEISEDGRKFMGAMVVARRIAEDGVLKLQTERDGQDDNKPAVIRMTYQFGEALLVMRKEVRFADADDYLQRNEYRFTR